MKPILSAVFAFAAAAAFAADAKEAPKPVKTASPAAAVASLLTFKSPDGWKAEEYANGADPIVAYSDGFDRIAARAFGAPGSAYKTPAEFLAGPAGTSMGAKAEDAGKAVVAGRKVSLYKRRVPLDLGDPHIPGGPTRFGAETFCVIPAAKGRFVVLSYARESPVPDLEDKGEKSWENLLKTVKLPGRKA